MPNEVQTLSFSPTPTAGTYTLTFYGQTTGPINYNDDDATIQAALEALSTIGTGNVSVSGEADAGPIVLTFQGELAATDVPQTSCDASGLSSAGTIGGVAETTTGVPASNEIVSYDFSASVGGSDALSWTGGATGAMGTGVGFNGDDSVDQATLQMALNTFGATWATVTSVSDSVATISVDFTVVSSDVTFTSANSGPISIIADGVVGTAEVQSLPYPTATGGMFSLAGQSVSYNPAVSDINTALSATSINATVAQPGGTGTAFTITWNSAGPQTLLAVDGSGLTSTVTATASTTQAGGPPIAYGSILQSTMISCPRTCA